MKIILNAESIEWKKSTISYEDILTYLKKSWLTVVVSYPTNIDKRSRTLTKFQSIDVYDGIIIEAMRTDLA